MSGEGVLARVERVRARTKNDPATLARLAVLAEMETESLTTALKDAERKNGELSKLIVEQEREYHRGRKDAERERERLRQDLYTSNEDAEARYAEIERLHGEFWALIAVADSLTPADIRRRIAAILDGEPAPGADQSGD